VSRHTRRIFKKTSQAETHLASSWPTLAIGYDAVQLFPAGLGSGGGLGLKGSCGKTNEPGSCAGFGDSGPVPRPEEPVLCDLPVLCGVPVLVEWEEDFFEFPFVRPLLPEEDLSLSTSLRRFSISLAA
jgi:hypothetical protein